MVPSILIHRSPPFFSLVRGPIWIMFQTLKSHVPEAMFLEMLDQMGISFVSPSDIVRVV